MSKNPANLEGEVCWRQKIAYATDADIPEWMELVHLVIDGFPHLDEGKYLGQLREYIRNRRASAHDNRQIFEYLNTFEEKCNYEQLSLFD